MDTTTPRWTTCTIVNGPEAGRTLMIPDNADWWQTPRDLNHNNIYRRVYLSDGYRQEPTTWFITNEGQPLSIIQRPVPPPEPPIVRELVATALRPLPTTYRIDMVFVNTRPRDKPAIIIAITRIPYGGAADDAAAISAIDRIAREHDWQIQVTITDRRTVV